MKNRWIKCSDKLPENNDTVFITDCGHAFYKIGFGYYSESEDFGKYWNDNSLTNPKIQPTHWMLLPPKPPKK